MILALQTADATARFWLLGQTAAPASAAPTLEWDSGRQLADGLLAKITELLAGHQAGLADLTGIIIFSGPGSFTSLRIGHSVANALADSLGLPVVSARGNDWLVTGAAAVMTAVPGRPALPYYGAEAHITKPRT